MKLLEIIIGAVCFALMAPFLAVWFVYTKLIADPYRQRCAEKWVNNETKE